MGRTNPNLAVTLAGRADARRWASARHLQLEGDAARVADALARLRASGAGVLVARDPAALGGLAERAALVAVLRRSGVRVAFASGQPDPDERAALELAAAFDRAHRRWHGAAMSAAARRRVQGGRSWGGRTGAPYGWAAGPGSRLERHEAEQRALAAIARLRREGASWPDVAAHLQAHHPEAARGRSWTLANAGRVWRAHERRRLAGLLPPA